MPGRRKLYTGEESAQRGLFVLRVAAMCNLVVTPLFVLFFDRAKHDPAFTGVNPFAVDPYDAVGSFGVQLGIVCAIIAVIRATRTDLKTESLYNRYTYTLRAIGVTQIAIIVTMCANLAALIRVPSAWGGSSKGILLATLTGGLLSLASGSSLCLIVLAKRREVCSKNPLGRPQIIPFLVFLILLGIYPAGWREGVAGAMLTALAGMVFLFYSVTILSKAMFPCPDIPERDLVDDCTGILRGLFPRLGNLFAQFDPRNHQWTLLALVSILAGGTLGVAEITKAPASETTVGAFAVAAVFLLIESAGIFIGYALLRRFLGIVRSS
ncbi:MAG TPA: hypothetical protein VMF59_08680 [Bacteroidota bacterium]|nr:hypothetical protein [Bacteroidota bacterium]